MANTFRQYLQAETIILQVDLIVCFRNLQKRTDDAVSLFGDKEAGGICVLKGYKEYYYGYDGKAVYVDLIDELQSKYPLTEPQIIGESAQKAFIGLFGAILRMRNLLSSFDDFAGNEILSEREMQDYQGRYNDLYDEWRNRRKEHEKEDITDDIVFEVELIKQIEINIDYILLLVEKYHDGHKSDKELLITINKAVDSSLELRSKKSLIQNFIAGINDVDDVLLEWKEFVVKKKEEELAAIIAEEKLKNDETRKFVEYSFRDGVMKTTGTDIDKIMPPMSRFGGGREKKKESIIQRLLAFFERFFGIG
jgi:type I restriction enzyme R subunit